MLHDRTRWRRGADSGGALTAAVVEEGKEGLAEEWRGFVGREESVVVGS